MQHRLKSTIGRLAMVAAAMLLATQSGCRLLGGPAPPSIIPALAGGSGWDGFARPQEEVEPELVMLRPYEPGKIPVVFIHGLLSQPGTWNDMLAALDADAEITERYQFWVFRYPTGVSYLQSAHDLRTQLRETVERIDPERLDAALSQMVLVGHSMGGLVAKLQVTHSDDLLWSAVSDQPFEDLQADEETRRAINDALFFEPLPFASRVVFIATPHGGSQWTRRPVARLGRRMIEFPQQIRQDYQQLVREN